MKSDAVDPGVAEAVMASSSSEKSDDAGSMESESARVKTGRRSFEEVRSEFTDFGSDEADISTDLNEHETGDFIEINGNENIGFVDLDKSETDDFIKINGSEGSGFVDLDKAKTSLFAEINGDDTKVSTDFSEVVTGTSDDGGTAEGVDKVDSFLNTEENDIGMPFDADLETGEEISSGEIKIDSASEESAETSADNGLKKKYDTEEDAYAAYVQWKKDHGITIDNPDPFHNIHHKSNGNG